MPRISSYVTYSVMILHVDMTVLHTVSSVNVLHDKSDFADVIKLKILRW